MNVMLSPLLKNKVTSKAALGLLPSENGNSTFLEDLKLDFETLASPY
jgi:hypothetical protein